PNGCTWRQPTSFNISPVSMPTIDATVKLATICPGTQDSLNVVLGNVSPPNCNYSLILRDNQDAIWNGGGHIDVIVNGVMPGTSYACTGTSPSINSINLPNGAF